MYHGFPKPLLCRVFVNNRPLFGTLNRDQVCDASTAFYSGKNKNVNAKNGSAKKYETSKFHGHPNDGMRQKKDELKARPDQQINGADEASVAISTQPARDIRISSSNAFLFLELETRRILGRPGNVDAYEAARLAGPNRPAMYVAIQTDAIANAGGKCDTHFYCTALIGSKAVNVMRNKRLLACSFSLLQCS